MRSPIELFLRRRGIPYLVAGRKSAATAHWLGPSIARPSQTDPVFPLDCFKKRLDLRR